MKEAKPLPLVSVDELAHRFGVSEATIYALVHRRQIESVKIGSRVLFREEAVEDYLDRRTRAVA